MRTIVKRVIERASYRSGLLPLLRKRLRGRGLVLAYHNIVPSGFSASGDASLHLAQATFARQLDILAATHEVVTLGTILEDPGTTKRPRVALTFDDAYTGALTAGLYELARRSMPATIFVTPALLGSSPWWDRLADVHSGEIAPERRSHALQALEGRHERILEWAAEGKRSGELSSQIATEQLLLEASRGSGIAMESHTWSHANLSVLSDDAMREELVRPATWLRNHLGSSPRFISYPYGLYSSRVEAVVEACGYDAAFRVDGGWIHDEPRTRRFAVPRYNVPAGLSLDGFRLRLAGIATKS